MDLTHTPAPVIGDWEIILWFGLTDEEWTSLPDGDKFDLRVLMERHVLSLEG